MKILYITIPNTVNSLPNNIKADYMSDLLYYGLTELVDVTAVPAKLHLYENFEAKSDLWGRGFSYTNLLKSDHVNNDYDSYDFIFVSVHHSEQFNYSTTLDVIRKHSGAKIVAIDGHDLPHFSRQIVDEVDFYFKREIYCDDDRLLPINFAIPSNKIINKAPVKVKDFADQMPGAVEWGSNSRKSFVYQNESDYYKNYQDAKFAFTCKKGGWDCLRHYEILANGCVPIFTDIENCPKNTLTNLPKQLLSNIKKIDGLNLNETCFTGDKLQSQFYSLSSNFNNNQYQDILYNLIDYTKNNLTTRHLAKKVLERITNE